MSICIASRIKQLLLIAATWCAVACATSAPVRAEKLLRVKFTTGQQFTTEIEQHTTSGDGRRAKVRIHDSIIVLHTVEDVDEQGVATIKHQFQRIVMSHDGGALATFGYDSVAAKSSGEVGAVLQPIFEALLRASCTSKISPHNEIIDFTAPADVVEMARGVVKVQGLAQYFTPHGLAELLNMGVIGFPEQPVAKGEQWTSKSEEAGAAGRTVISKSFRYEGEQKLKGKKVDKLRVSINMERAAGEKGLPWEQSNTGWLYFDAETGHLAQATMEQHVRTQYMFQGRRQPKQVIVKAEFKVSPNSGP